MRQYIPAGHRLEVYCCLPLGNIGRGYFCFISHHSSKCSTGMYTRLRLDQETVITRVDMTKGDSKIALNN